MTHPLCSACRCFATAALLLAVLVVAGCGGEPAPTVVPAPPTATAALENTAVPAMTAAVATTEPAATAESSVAPTVPSSTDSTAPVTLQALEPTQDWAVRSLKVGPGRTYAFLETTRPGRGVAGYQLLFSDDDGKTWAPFVGGLPPVDCINSVDLDYASQDALFAGACDGGLYRWTGSEWAHISDQRVGRLEVVYQQPQIMWSANPGAASGEPTISRSDDGGRTWSPADSGIGADRITHLGIDPRDSNTLYALGTELHQGTAEGRWQVITTLGVGEGAFTGIAIEGGNGALYVSEIGAANRIWRSENANPPDVTAIRWGVVHQFEKQAVELLATGPSAGGLALYANLAELHPVEGGTLVADWLPYRSPDGGVTWERIVIPGWIE